MGIMGFEMVAHRSVKEISPLIRVVGFGIDHDFDAAI